LCAERLNQHRFRIANFERALGDAAVVAEQVCGVDRQRNTASRARSRSAIVHGQASFSPAEILRGFVVARISTSPRSEVLEALANAVFRVVGSV
jgi:cobyrinic acid a,c-diamide synthase